MRGRSIAGRGGSTSKSLVSTPTAAAEPSVEPSTVAAGEGAAAASIHELHHAPLRLDDIASVHVGSLPGVLVVTSVSGSSVVIHSLRHAAVVRYRVEATQRSRQAVKRRNQHADVAGPRSSTGPQRAGAPAAAVAGRWRSALKRLSISTAAPMPSPPSLLRRGSSCGVSRGSATASTAAMDAPPSPPLKRTHTAPNPLDGTPPPNPSPMLRGGSHAGGARPLEDASLTMQSIVRASAAKREFNRRLHLVGASELLSAQPRESSRLAPVGGVLVRPR